MNNKKDCKKCDRIKKNSEKWLKTIKAVVAELFLAFWRAGNIVTFAFFAVFSYEYLNLGGSINGVVYFFLLVTQVVNLWASIKAENKEDEE